MFVFISTPFRASWNGKGRLRCCLWDGNGVQRDEGLRLRAKPRPLWPGSGPTCRSHGSRPWRGLPAGPAASREWSAAPLSRGPRLWLRLLVAMSPCSVSLRSGGERVRSEPGQRSGKVFSCRKITRKIRGESGTRRGAQGRGSAAVRCPAAPPRFPSPLAEPEAARGKRWGCGGGCIQRGFASG